MKGRVITSKVISFVRFSSLSISGVNAVSPFLIADVFACPWIAEYACPKSFCYLGNLEKERGPGKNCSVNHQGLLKKHGHRITLPAGSVSAIFVVTGEAAHSCPCCGGPLKYRDRRQRKARDESGACNRHAGSNPPSSPESCGLTCSHDCLLGI